MTLQDYFSSECARVNSDIGEHLPALSSLASECESVVEIGVRSVVSSWAFLKGLSESPFKNKKMTSVDIIPPEAQNAAQRIADFRRISSELGVDFGFIKASSLEMPPIETDLLFIDTVHNYEFLSVELSRHGPFAKRYIALHDTEICKDVGHAGGGGMWKAVEEFVSLNPEWKIKIHFTNNNGLTILERSRMNKVSILTPTRKRVKMFTDSIDSLFNTCSSVDNFEVLVAMDTDDTDSIEKIREYAKDKPNIKIFLYERKTYYRLNEYINDLCEKSSGSSLVVWNDDCIMESKNWDLEIFKYHKDFCVISPKIGNDENYWRKQGAMFPIIPRKWLEITGQWTPISSCDSWIDVLSKRLDTLVNAEEIVINHMCFKNANVNNDEIYRETRIALVDPKFPRSNPEKMEEHYSKLKAYIDQNRATVPINIWKPS